MLSNPIQRIKSRLDTLGTVPYIATDRSVVIPAPDSSFFEARFALVDGGFEVAFAGWHEPFTNVEEALRCLAVGLSDQVRLRVESRGDFDHRWILESRNGDSWDIDSEMGLLLIPFWRQKCVRYLQHAIWNDSADVI